MDKYHNRLNKVFETAENAEAFISTEEYQEKLIDHRMECEYFDKMYDSFDDC